MPKFEEHECNLQHQKEDIVNQSIDSGIFIAFRRKFRSWCIISRSHPETLKYFKSYSACSEEEVRHLTRAYYIIHPFSMLNLVLECVFFLLFTAQIVLIATNAVYQHKHRGYIMMFRTLVEVFQMFDIIRLFFTGYYDMKRNSVVIDPAEIAKHYLRTYFFFDFFSCTYIFTLPLTRNEGTILPYFVTVAIRLSSRIKIVRIIRCRQALDLFREYMDYSDHVFKAIKTLFTYLMLVTWAFSIFFILDSYIERLMRDYEDTDIEPKALSETCYDATLLLQLVSFGRYDMEELIEFAMAAFFLCYGFTLQMYMLAQLLQVWHKYESTENRHYTLQKQFHQYVKYKNLPSSSRQRIYAYYQFKLSRHYFKQSDIHNMISPLLRQEILLHDTRSYISRVSFFQLIPEHILVNIVTKLKTEIFLPGDVIITAGLVGSNMYFLHYGTVAVYTPNGKEVCHLTDGAHFGEIALILSEKRIASIVTVSPSEVFVLTSKDFAAVIDPYPEIKQRLLEMATESLNKSKLELESTS